MGRNLMPYRPVDGRPTPDQLNLAAAWLRKNDVDDAEGLACITTANLLDHIAKRDRAKHELHVIRADDPELKKLIAALDSAGIIE